MQNNENFGIYTPPTNFPMIKMDANFEPGVMKQVIGKEGCYFKQFTQQTGVKYIWHNRNSNEIEIWGPQHCLENAGAYIQYRLYIVLMKMNNEVQLSTNSIEWMNHYHNWYNSYIYNPTQTNNSTQTNNPTQTNNSTQTNSNLQNSFYNWKTQTQTNTAINNAVNAANSAAKDANYATDNLNIY
jgi:hypothetical protein